LQSIPRDRKEWPRKEQAKGTQRKCSSRAVLFFAQNVQSLFPLILLPQEKRNSTRFDAGGLSSLTTFPELTQPDRQRHDLHWQKHTPTEPRRLAAVDF
jgi:hypothetical protein